MNPDPSDLDDLFWDLDPVETFLPITNPEE